MGNAEYVPDRGDLAWVDLNPQMGHEQAGRRPTLILSPKSYNRKTGLCILCPATRHAKGYAFEVENPSEEDSQSILLADHVRCIDWRTRRAEFIRHVPAEVLQEVAAKLEALIIRPDE